MATSVKVVCKDQNEANTMLRRLGEIERKLIVARAQVAEEVASLNQALDQLAQPLMAEQKKLIRAVEKYADKNRNTLLSGESKSVKLTSGEFGWRLSPPRVSILGEIKTIILSLKRRGLMRFVRIKLELDKEAILRYRPEIAGVEIVQDEKFFILPLEEVTAAERQVA